MKDKTERTREGAEMVREAAVRAEHAARRLLRRTRSLARQASRHLPAPIGPAGALGASGAPAGHITLPLPPLSVPVPEGTDERAPVGAVDEIALLRARLDRAEHATAWLRARLRAERLRGRSAPAIDADALAADLARELARLRTHDEGAVARMVRRVLAARGLPIATPMGSPHRPGAPIGDSARPRALPGWPRDQQEAVAAQVLARAPEVANPLYVYRALDLIAGGGGGTLSSLTRASRLDSAMGKRRLRLALDALVALGALVSRDGAYTLNTEYRPARPRPRQGQPAAGTTQESGGSVGSRGPRGPRGAGTAKEATTRPRR